MFNLSKIAISMAFLLATSNAAIVNLYSDQNCQNPAGDRNVYDNSCAPLGGFQSYKITYNGSDGQKLTAYSRNACAEPQTSCTDAVASDTCYTAVNGDGGSNAMGSGEECGIVI